ncbi:DUF6440 family protein [Mesorhizobium sp.]|uniref:DUF6440 family protein n=1 Tax=Mesorhizobium sp. TaxID=1871066 RepID=UPI000FEAAE02|nr:DUF6440 family protein [Mesorhizobium sp.]RWE44219.1 MAG: hypothetical protein EOS80_19965 [Mesorhizobium sp.]
MKHILLLAAGSLSLAIALVLIVNESPRDDTDPFNGRSGMRLYADARTGCQYLGAPGGGITPRLDAHGKQICEGRRS